MNQRALTRVNDAMCDGKYYAFPLRAIFALKKTGASQSSCWQNYPHVGYVHQFLPKCKPCGCSTFFSVFVATNVTVHDARDFLNELSVIAMVVLHLACKPKLLTKKSICCPNQDASSH